MLVLNLPCTVDNTLGIWSELTPPIVQPLGLPLPLVQIYSTVKQTKITTMLVLNIPCSVHTPFVVWSESSTNLRIDFTSTTTFRIDSTSSTNWL